MSASALAMGNDLKPIDPTYLCRSLCSRGSLLVPLLGSPVREGGWAALIKLGFHYSTNKYGAESGKLCSTVGLVDVQFTCLSYHVVEPGTMEIHLHFPGVASKLHRTSLPQSWAVTGYYYKFGTPC